jgi:integrase
MAPKFWTNEEIERILISSRRTYIHDMILVALNTGLRLNELRFLRWEDINLDKGFLLVQSHPEDSFNPKDYELRRIKLNYEVIRILKELKIKSIPSVPYVFSNKYGKPRIYNLERDLRRILKKIGVEEKGGWHCARRTWGSHAIMAGADPKSVQKIYGHSRLETTQAYLNVTDKHLDETMDLVGFSDSKKRGEVILLKKKG